MSDLNVFRMGAWILLLLNFLFIVSWTTVAISVSVSPEDGDRYVLPQVVHNKHLYVLLHNMML